MYISYFLLFSWCVSLACLTTTTYNQVTEDYAMQVNFPAYLETEPRNCSASFSFHTWPDLTGWLAALLSPSSIVMTRYLCILCLSSIIFPLAASSFWCWEYSIVHLCLYPVLSPLTFIIDYSSELHEFASKDAHAWIWFI